MGLIRSAKDVWNNQSERGLFNEACQGVMREIERASESGYRHCVFDPRPVDMYSSVKVEFQKFGYRFEPYGYCGGVRQDVENICW